MAPSSWRLRGGLCWAPLLITVFLRCHVALSQDPHLCFEKVSSLPGIYMQEHPSGGKLTVATQDGLIRLLSLPAVGTGLEAQELSTFLDLSSRVLEEGEQGLLSFAFHPRFLENGRFFVSYICNPAEHRDCQAKCSTETFGEPNCPSTTIVAEYEVDGPPNATRITSKEEHQILKIGRPYENHVGGHIWFGPDGYLYYTSGDGGKGNDPLSTAQNGEIPLGKILRIDVDQRGTVTDWGNYTVPVDNPFVKRRDVMPEVFALGLRNPWRCSVDGPSNLTICGDVGQDHWEDVDIMRSGGNYGWSFFEGPRPLKPDPPANPVGGPFLAPVFAYEHSKYENEDDEDAGLAVIGGHVYRANRNPCLQGKYVFGDMYGGLFLGDLFEPNSTTLSSNATFTSTTFSVSEVSLESPSPDNPTTSLSESTSKSALQGTGFPLSDLLFSWGVDNSMELYRLSSSGIYRVTDAALCNRTCGELKTNSSTSPPGSSGGSDGPLPANAPPPPPLSSPPSSSPPNLSAPSALSGLPPLPSTDQAPPPSAMSAPTPSDSSSPGPSNAVPPSPSANASSPSSSEIPEMPGELPAANVTGGNSNTTGPPAGGVPTPGPPPGRPSSGDSLRTNSIAVLRSVLFSVLLFVLLLNDVL